MRATNLFVLTTVFALAACSNSTSTDRGDPVGIRNIWWSLMSFEAVSGDTITLASNESYLVLFADSLWGKTDSLCSNTYYTTYWIGTNDSVVISPIVTTKRGCRSSYMEYLLALRNANSFQISGNKLTIFHSGGTRKMAFVKQ